MSTFRSTPVKEQETQTTPLSLPDCSICLRNLENYNTLVTLNCGHKFHLVCVIDFFHKTDLEGDIKYFFIFYYFYRWV